MFEPDRLPLAQKALNVLIDQLRPQDHVALVPYAGSAGEVLPPTTGREKLRMRCAVNALEAGGSTAGGAGLSLAYALAEQNFDKQAVNRIVLMTDGDFNVGVTNNKSLEQFVADKRKTGVYLSIYGYGRGNYQDARMQAIAQNGNGTAAYVDSLDEARKIFRDDFEGSMFPIADDVKLQVEFNPAQIAEYRLIGYETRMLAREDFNNDAVDAGEVGAGVAVTALYEVTPVGGPASVDPLRYGVPVSPRAASGGSELAYLKIRYKLPGQSTSKLIETPINQAVTYASLDKAPESTRWATSVAAYGQKLSGSAYVSDDFTWDQDLSLAQAAKGADPYGLRAEFIGLVRSAKDLRIQSASR
jgi:Ca-activated chloride channel family protein